MGRIVKSLASKPRARPGARASFTVTIYPGDDGFLVAYCKELPGCVSQGRTLKEVQENIQEAMMLYIETLSELVSGTKGKAGSRGGRTPVKVARFSLEPVSA